MDTPQQDKISSPPPQAKWWVDGQRIRFKGFWFRPEFITASEAIRAHYTPLSSDIILASFPKTGTTWLKALTSSILRHSTTIHDDYDRLDHLNPHEVVPFLEIELFGENPSKDITKISSPRVFNTHLPLSFLPETVKTSGSKVIYITRHPADTFVSLWHLYNNKFGTEISIREAFDDFCKGLVPAGPYFEHVLEFWEVRDRVLFVTYEDLKADPEENVKRIADFLGCKTMVEKVVKECSFENLRNTSKDRGEGVHWSGTKYDMFFRKGVVGDWKNHLTQEMMKELEDIADLRTATFSAHILALDPIRAGLCIHFRAPKVSMNCLIYLFCSLAQIVLNECSETCVQLTLKATPFSCCLEQDRKMLKMTN